MRRLIIITPLLLAGCFGHQRVVDQEVAQQAAEIYRAAESIQASINAGNLPTAQVAGIQHAALWIIKTVGFQGDFR